MLIGWFMQNLVQRLSVASERCAHERNASTVTQVSVKYNLNPKSATNLKLAATSISSLPWVAIQVLSSSAVN